MSKIRISVRMFLFITAWSLLFFACKKSNPSTPPNVVKSYPVITVEDRTLSSYKEYPVNIEGQNNNDVRAKVSGYIKSVLVDEGQIVTKGQVLFRLETNMLNQNASAARSGVIAAQANVKAAEASVVAAQVEVSKIRPLVEKKIISQVQLETANANLLSAQSQLRQAEAMLNQAKANNNSINENIAYAVIRSPINGVVGKLPLKVGSLVGPSDQTPLTTVSDINILYAYFSMNESDYLDFLEKSPGKSVAQKLKNLDAVTLILANEKPYNHKGKVEAVTGQIDPTTGTIRFRASFPNPERLLSNGNSGKIRMPFSYPNVITIPESSTFEQQGKVIVYKVEADSVVSTVINVLDRVNNFAVVGSGLKKGDQIVASSISGLRTGTKIKANHVNMDSIVKELKPIF